MFFDFTDDGNIVQELNNNKDNLVVTRTKDPTSTENMPIGTTWVNTSTNDTFMCIANTPNKNVWLKYQPVSKVTSDGTVVLHTVNNTSNDGGYTGEKPGQRNYANVLDVFGDKSCVALWQFDGNANDTGGVYNGKEKGDVKYVNGKYNKAIYLNGTNAYVDLGNKMTGTYYSFSFWADWSNTNKNYERIFDFGEDHGSNWQCFISRAYGYNKLCYRNSGDNIYSKDDYIINNELHHYAVVQDGGTVYFYRDGKLFSETSTTFRPTNHSRSHCYIGKSNYPSDSLYEGVIDQLRIFNRPLTSKEVERLYNEKFSNSSISVVDIFEDKSALALYQLDDNTNDTGGIYNAVGHNIAYKEGKFGQAVNYYNASESKYIVTKDKLKRNGSKEITISGWIYVFGHTGTWINIWHLTPDGENYNGNSRQPALWLNYRNNKEFFTMNDGVNQKSLGIDESKGKITYNKWHHIVQVVTLRQMKLYIDGKLTDTYNSSEDFKFNDGQFYIGDKWHIKNHLIDQVRVFNRALNDNEVERLYNEE